MIDVEPYCLYHIDHFYEDQSDFLIFTVIFMIYDDTV